MKSVYRIGILFLFLSSLSIQAQEGVGGLRLGYNMNFTNGQGFEVLVDRYNSSYTNLVQQLPDFNYLDGISYHFYLAWGDNDYLSGGVLEIGYDNRSKSQIAVFDANGTRFEEQIRYSLNTGNFGFGIPIRMSYDGLISLGLRTNVGSLKVKSRLAREGTVRDEEWEDLESMLYMDFEVNLKLVIQGFSIEPYYTFSADKLFGSMNNLYYINRELNPDTYQLDGDRIPLNSGAFGIRIMVAIFIS